MKKYITLLAVALSLAAATPSREVPPISPLDRSYIVATLLDQANSDETWANIFYISNGFNHDQFDQYFRGRAEGIRAVAAYLAQYNVQPTQPSIP